MELNRLNGLYHNFVSSDGQTDTSVGVSVLNGLPEIEDYMFTSTVPLDGITAFWLMTDGLFWPAPLDESEPDVALRLQSMADHVMNNGLASYVVALREHESYVRESGINPYQWHDDVTSILLHVLN